MKEKNYFLFHYVAVFFSNFLSLSLNIFNDVFKFFCRNYNTKLVFFIWQYELLLKHSKLIVYKLSQYIIYYWQNNIISDFLKVYKDFNLTEMHIILDQKLVSFFIQYNLV